MDKPPLGRQTVIVEESVFIFGFLLKKKELIAGQLSQHRRPKMLFRARLTDPVRGFPVHFLRARLQPEKFFAI